MDTFKLKNAFLLRPSVLLGMTNPHRQCVTTRAHTSNRISCTPTIDLLTSTWDYIRMECNTSGADGQPVNFKLHYREPWSEVSVPTMSSGPSNFERKWLGGRAAFMDIPQCSVFVNYVLGEEDPRLCSWHCYRVRAGIPDEELCIADARRGVCLYAEKF